MNIINIYPSSLIFNGIINNDEVVDIYDVVIVSIAFGSEPGDPNWNQAADINNDGIVDIYDVVIVASVFGKSRQEEILI